MKSPLPPRRDVSARAFAWGVVLLVTAQIVALVALAAVSPLTDDEPTYLMCGLALRVGEPDWREFALWLQGPLTYWASQLFAADYWPTDPLDPGWFRARLGMIVFPVLGALAIAGFVRWALDRRTALFALLLYGSWPVLLGNGCLVAADSSHIGCWLLALWITARYLERPSLRLVIALGAVLGLALAMKYVAMLLLPALIAGIGVALVRGLRPRLACSRRSGHPLARLADAAASALICAAVAGLTLWCCYLFEPPAFSLQEHGLQGKVFGAIASVGPGRALCEALPAPWVRGIDAMLACADYSGTYCLGEIGVGGHPGYYGLAILTKTPIAVLLLLPFGFARRAWRSDTRLLVALAIAFPLGYASFFQDLQAGLRHLLPSVALLAIPAAIPLAAWWSSRTRLARGVVIAVLASLAVCHAITWPNYIGAFNSLVGDRPFLLFRMQNLDWTHYSEERRQAGVLKERGIAIINAQGGPRLGIVAALGEDLCQGLPGTTATHWLRSFHPIERFGAYWVFDAREPAFRQVAADLADDERDRLDLAAALATEGRIDEGLAVLDAVAATPAVGERRATIEALRAAGGRWNALLALGRNDLVVASADAPRMARVHAAMARAEYRTALALLGPERPLATSLEVAVATAAHIELQELAEALAELDAHGPGDAEYSARFAEARALILWKQRTAAAKARVRERLRAGRLAR